MFYSHRPNTENTEIAYLGCTAAELRSRIETKLNYLDNGLNRPAIDLALSMLTDVQSQIQHNSSEDELLKQINQIKWVLVNYGSYQSNRDQN